MTNEEAFRMLMRPGTPALAENTLVEMAESFSLYVLSTLEFQNSEG